MSIADEYRVRLEVFEGPLDLLLYLIRKEEVDIHDIPIERITSQYLEYLNLMQMLDLEVAGEFLVMAATLMAIKSRMLLPEEERAAEEPGAEEPGEDPRWELVRRLIEYKKFKDAARELQERALAREDVFTREGMEAAAVTPGEVPLEDVSLFDLLNALNRALSRMRREEAAEIFAERYTVADKIEHLTALLREAPRWALSELFGRMRSRHEIVVTFLAMLELIRLRRLRAVQPVPFGEIWLERIGDEAREGETDDGSRG